jgi:hypothetical protein
MNMQLDGRADRSRGLGIDSRRSGALCAARFARQHVTAVAMTLPIAAMIAVPAATAATRTTAVTDLSHIAARTMDPRSASVCNKVSAAAVAAIVGHPAPAQTAEDSSKQYSAAETGVGVPGVVTACLYGSGGTYILQFTSATKPLTVSGVEKVIKASATASDQLKFTSYSGLGVPGFGVTSVSSGTRTEEIAGVVGKTVFSAGTSNSLTVSKLAALAKLAKKL